MKFDKTKQVINLGKFDKNQELLKRFLAFILDMGCDAFFEEKEIQSNVENLEYFGSAVYIQMRKNRKVYVGETVNLSQRTMTHTGNGVEIECMGAISTWMLTDEERLAMESYVINEAILAGFPLANLDKVDEEPEKTPLESPEAKKTEEVDGSLVDNEDGDLFPP